MTLCTVVLVADYLGFRPYALNKLIQLCWWLNTQLLAQRL